MCNCIKDLEEYYSSEKETVIIIKNNNRVQIPTKPTSNTRVSNINASNGVVYLKSEHSKYCPVCGEKYDEKEFKYINHFIDDEDSTWDSLAKEICKKYPNEVEDFIWCLLDNLDIENRLEVVDMVCNMEIKG